MKNTLNSRNRLLLAWSLPTDQLEITLGLLSFFWGLGVLLPFDSFDQSLAFGLFLQLLPEWCYGLIVFLSGLFRLLFWLLDINRLRRFSALLDIFIWGFITWFAAFQYPYSTAVFVYGFICLFPCTFVYFRLPSLK